jgi:hypothetical protein
MLSWRSSRNREESEPCRLERRKFRFPTKPESMRSLKSHPACPADTSAFHYTPADQRETEQSAGQAGRDLKVGDFNICRG